MNAEFEEKTYENYFNTELDTKSSIYFPFGQVQEGVIGIDSAANSRNRRLWRMLGYPFWFRPHFPGADLSEIAKEMQRYIGEEVCHIPPMQVNLLIQYKRPEYIISRLGKEWDHWNKSYYRYDIYKTQHDLLIHLEKIFGAEALIIYAAPAISKISELVNIKKQRKIIDNSNFKKAAELTGHERNTYIEAGTYSIACSEPERIDNFHLVELLASQQKSNNLSNKEFIIRANEKAIKGLSNFKVYFAAYNSLMEEYAEIKNYNLLYSFISMKAIKELTGIQWLIKTEA